MKLDDDLFEDPKPGSIWQHHKGGIYTVLFMVNDLPSDRYPRMVVYRGANGKLWAGRLDDWHRRMTALGNTFVATTKGDE